MVSQVTLQEKAQRFSQTCIRQTFSCTGDFRGRMADCVRCRQQRRNPCTDGGAEGVTMRGRDWRSRISSVAAMTREQISHQTDMPWIVGLGPRRQHLYENILPCGCNCGHEP